MHHPRHSLLSAAFTAAPLTCGPLTLRPISAGSWLLLIELKNPIFVEAVDSDAPVDLSESDRMAALFQFIFLHSAPVEDVLRLAADPAELAMAVKRLALSISFHDLDAFLVQFGAINQRIAAAAAQIITDPAEGSPGKPVSGPTGSPASSTASEALPIPSASTTSSGIFRSSVPSNTPTPPMPPMAPASAGPSQWEMTTVGDQDFLIPLP